MQPKNVFDQFQRFLHETSGDFHILEQKVPVEIQMEYFRFSDRLRKEPDYLKNVDYDLYATDLQNQDSPFEYKRHILSTLAISKQVKAYRILEEYAQAPSPELTNWAYMALMESRITLESELSDEKQIYISTGLGGKGHKLRFFVLLLAAKGNPFLEYQQQVIEREFAYALSKVDAEIDRLTIREKHVELVMLIPIQQDIKQLLEAIIKECNQYGHFISNNFTITNVRELDEKEIAKIIKSHETDMSVNPHLRG
ncbi:MAG: hypothetical protein LBN71_05735 [Tannerella sp.]|jgi:hypothetical protein|nr:hypothetical protein [Tannerella sp.]